MKKNYVFVTPAEWGMEAEVGMEDLISLFHTYKEISTVDGMPRPYVDVIEISEGLREAISNHLVLEHGLTFCARHLVVIPEKQAYVLILSMDMLKKYIEMYENSLRHTQEKLIKSLNELTEQVLYVSQFKAKFIAPYEKR